MNRLQTMFATLMVCLAVSCKSRPSEVHAIDDSPSREALAPADDYSGVTVASLLKTQNAKPLNLGSRNTDAFRLDVLTVAAETGKSPMSIVAPLIMEDEDDVRRLTMVLNAFDESEMHMDLAKHLPAGTPRRLVVGILVRRFEEAKDPRDLELLHGILPPGPDRQEVAAALATMKSSKTDRSPAR